MAVFLVGFMSLAKLLTRYISQNLLLTVLFSWWIILQIVGLVTVAGAYYDIHSVSSFIIQVSQYKPLLFKGLWWYVWFGLSGLSIAFFGIMFIKEAVKKIN